MKNKKMKSFLIAIIVLLMSASSSFAESTIMWYWMTDTNERITYTVTVDENVDTDRMNMFNHSLTTLSQNNQFSNLSQFENIVNRVATGEIRDFQIVDVTVNER